MSLSLIIVIFLFEIITAFAGLGILIKISDIEEPEWVNEFLEKHYGKLTVVLVLGYNAWKSYFIVEWILNWYLTI